MPSWGGQRYDRSDSWPPVQGLPILYERSSFPHNRFESQLFPIFSHTFYATVGGIAAREVLGPSSPERQSLSARQAAEPQEKCPNSRGEMATHCYSGGGAAGDLRTRAMEFRCGWGAWPCPRLPDWQEPETPGECLDDCTDGPGSS